MKKLIITLLAVAVFSSVNAQDSTQKKQDELNKKAFGTKDNFVGGKSKKLVAIMGYNINSVNKYFLTYLQDDLGFNIKDFSQKPTNQMNTFTLVPKISNSPNRKIVLHQQLNDSFEISKDYIDGYCDDVIKLFCDYWDTIIDFESAKKQQTAVKFCYTDKVILSVDLAKKYAKIQIERNK
jgi:hypothetical protein